jgi:hypothetical protein
MLARSPSRTVTGAAAAAEEEDAPVAAAELELLAALELELELLEEQPAINRAPPTMAAVPAKMARIYLPFPIGLLG